MCFQDSHTFLPLIKFGRQKSNYRQGTVPFLMRYLQPGEEWYILEVYIFIRLYWRRGMEYTEYNILKALPHIHYWKYAVYCYRLAPTILLGNDMA